ncbi:MAG: 50S ribosomal protein L22 [Candidatus Woesearchaeota archaeon]
MVYNYATQNMTERMAKAVLVSQSISTKQSIEIASYIRGMTTTRALAALADAKDEKRAIPFKRFTNGVGHKPGMGPGRFPKNAISVFEKALKLAIANAADFALDTDSLRIYSAIAQRGSKTPRYGRVRGRTAKVTHIEIVVEEFEQKSKQKSTKSKSSEKTESKASETVENTQKQTVTESKSDKTAESQK